MGDRARPRKRATEAPAFWRRLIPQSGVGRGRQGSLKRSRSTGRRPGPATVHASAGSVARRRAVSSVGGRILRPNSPRSQPSRRRHVRAWPPPAHGRSISSMTNWRPQARTDAHRLGGCGDRGLGPRTPFHTWSIQARRRPVSPPTGRGWIRACICQRVTRETRGGCGFARRPAQRFSARRSLLRLPGSASRL